VALTHGPVRVTHMVPALFGDDGVVGGAERYALELARSMSHSTPTCLLTFGSRESDDASGGLRVRVLGARSVRGQRTNPFTLRIASALRDADVIHCHQTHVLSSSFAALVARATGRRAFTTDLGGGGWDVSGYVPTDRWFHGHLHISEYSRRISGHAGKPWAHVISGGVDTGRFSPDDRIARDGTAVFVGRILPHKGVDHLIEAAPPDMPVEVIGRSYDAAYLDRLRNGARGKRVTFRLSCTDAEVIDAYRRAMCVVLPSVYKTADGRETLVPELLGQTLLEGMACATPAVASDVASLPEVVEDDVSGFLFSPGDVTRLRERLQWLRQHPADARAMGLRARQRILDRFQWRAVVDRCLSIYAA
jgi:glycosyltransferase involved in cell wall biosynthesis